MVINTSFATLLAEAKIGGSDFTRTITFGRQTLAAPDYDLSRLSSTLRNDKTYINLNTGKFSDDFIWPLLGDYSVRSIDYSYYQHANFIHDLNSPIPDTMENQYGPLIDGGTLERTI